MTSDEPADRPVVAYVLDLYPELSETFIRLEIDEMRRQGVNVQVLALRRSDTATGDETDVWWVNEELDVSRLRLGFAHLTAMVSHPRRYLAARNRVRQLASEADRFRWRRMPWLAQQLRRSGVRWIHAHFAWSGAAAAAVLAELADLPWSMTLHAKDIFSDRRNLEKKLAWADHLVTVCEYNRSWLAEHFDVTRPLSVVICGVHVPELRPVAERVDVVAVARFVEKKGLDVLVRAAAVLAPDLPGISIELIGSGPLFEEINALVAELGMCDTVRLRGARPHDEVLERIAESRIYCFPGRIAADGDRDSMPVVIKEAMARGVAVVGSDVVGIPEMVDATTGWLVRPDDHQALAGAIRAALTDPAERRRRGAAGYARVSERFRIETEVAKLRAIVTRGRAPTVRSQDGQDDRALRRQGDARLPPDG